MSEEGSLLEELRTAYRGLGRKERQQVKTLLLTLGELQRFTGKGDSHNRAFALDKMVVQFKRRMYGNSNRNRNDEGSTNL